MDISRILIVRTLVVNALDRLNRLLSIVGVEGGLVPAAEEECSDIRTSPTKGVFIVQLLDRIETVI